MFLITSASEQTLIVIGQLHDHQTQPAHYFHQSNFIFNWRTVLRPEDDADAAFFFRQVDISWLINRSDQIWIGLKSLVPLPKARQGLSGVLVISKRDMHRAEPTLTHLLKDLAGPS